MRTDFSPTCFWHVSPDLILALAKHLGDPTDAYINGSQVWIRDDGPNEMAIEWRLHPVPHYECPADVDSYDVFPLTALGYSDQSELVELPAPLEQLWDGLEAFPAYGDETEPQPLADACAKAIGVAPDAFGLVNHQQIGDDWERSQRAISISEHLLNQLSAAD